jgi:hypothetical protein
MTKAKCLNKQRNEWISGVLAPGFLFFSLMSSAQNERHIKPGLFPLDMRKEIDALAYGRLSGRVRDLEQKVEHLLFMQAECRRIRHCDRCGDFSEENEFGDEAIHF